MIDLVCISDTHLEYTDIPPPARVLVIAGDVLSGGTISEYKQFIRWLSLIPENHYEFKILVPGNHDIYIENFEDLVREELKDLRVDMLIDKAKIYKFSNGEQLMIYGSPWIPMIGYSKRWAYELSRGDELARKWSLIPEGLDLLITHSPPHMIMDNIRYRSGAESDHWGCLDLRHKLMNMQKPPRAHVFGHVHDPVQGKRMSGRGIDFYNVAVCNEQYDIGFVPTRIYL